MSIDYNKFIENQKNFGCDEKIDSNSLSNLAKNEDYYIAEVDNDDILLQILMYNRKDLGMFRIYYFSIILKSKKYDYEYAIKELGKKILDYMKYINCYTGYVVYGDKFGSMEYIDLIPVYLKPLKLNLEIDKQNKTMKILKVF